MQKLKIGLAAVLVALTGQAVAGAFDGPYVQLGIGGASTQTESNYNELGLGNRNSNEGAFLGQILGGYSRAFDRFNLAGNVFYNIGNQKSGKNSAAATASGYTGTISQEFTMKNTWGVSLEPGVYFADKSLGYLKLSYYNSQMNYDVGARLTGPDINYSSGFNSSKSMNGIGYGLGFKQLFTENIYGLVEYQYVQYDTWNDGPVSYKPNQNYGWIGVGYKF